MPRFKPYSYEQTKLMPVDFKRQFQSGTFEFALNRIIDEMDLSVFDGRFHNDDTGAPAYDPGVLRHLPMSVMRWVLGDRGGAVVGGPLKEVDSCELQGGFVD